MIVIAEQETVYDRFPTPLINRLEKHRLVMESILESQKLEVLREFHIWIDKFTEVTTSQRYVTHLTLSYVISEDIIMVYTLLLHSS